MTSAVSTCTNSRCTKFQANIFIAMDQKPGKDDSVILNAIFGISNCRTAKQMTFSELSNETIECRY